MAHNLPTELRRPILEYCANISTALNLAKTSKAFYVTWESDFQPICETISKKSIEGYEDASALAKVQIDLPIYALLCQPASIDAPPSIAEQREIDFRKTVVRMLSNAKRVEQACEVFPEAAYEDWKLCKGKKAVISPTERARFVKVYYSIWRLATPGHPKTRFSTRSMRIILVMVGWLIVSLDTYCMEPTRGLGARIEVLWSVLWANNFWFSRFDAQEIRMDARKFLINLEESASMMFGYDGHAQLNGLGKPSIYPWHGVRILRDDHQRLLDDLEEGDP